MASSSLNSDLNPAPSNNSSTLPSSFPPPSDPVLHAHVTALHDSLIAKSPIYTLILRDAQIQHVSRGHVTARLALSAAHLNSRGSLHGSATATLVDWAGGLAIAAWDARAKTGVSVDISVSYLSGAKDGDTVEVEGVAERVGGSLAFTAVRVWRVEDGARGALVAAGRHTKYVKAG